MCTLKGHVNMGANVTKAVTEHLHVVVLQTEYYLLYGRSVIRLECVVSGMSVLQCCQSEPLATHLLCYLSPSPRCCQFQVAFILRGTGGYA